MSLQGAADAPRLAIPATLDRRLIEGRDRKAAVVDLNGTTMGTTWSVRVALPQGRDPALLQHAIEQRLDRLVAQMSHWAPGSSLAHYNRAAAGSWCLLEPEFATVMAAGLAVAARSGSAFDPAIGRLTDLWGLGPRAVTEVPGDADIATARTASGWHRLARAGRWLRQPGSAWLDLSGIAKGYAADSVADLLKQAGAEHALVEVGGECVGRGVRPDGSPWWVELETLPDFGLMPIRVALHEMAVATSGSYVRGVHTIDPRSGYPAGQAPTVSVLHRSCMVADAWATALAVLDRASATSLAERERLPVRIVADDGREWLSPALRTMTQEAPGDDEQ